MMRFQSNYNKEIVSAIQFNDTIDTLTEISRFLGSDISRLDYINDNPVLFINTKNEILKVQETDWVIRYSKNQIEKRKNYDFNNEFTSCI